jgi:FkbM family methyltransferase
MLVYLVQDIFKDKIYTAFLSPSSGDVVIDLGAHIGLFTISVAKFAKLVVAIEPHPENYRYLLTNVKLNKFGNVITCRLACSDKEGTGKLYLGHHSGSHSLLFRRSSLRAIDVPLITLSKLVRDLGLNRVDFIKMDIEGAEYSVLVGASQILKSYDVKLAIAAYHDDDIRRKCNQLLTELGYKVLEKRGFLCAWKPNGYKTE